MTDLFWNLFGIGLCAFGVFSGLALWSSTMEGTCPPPCQCKEKGKDYDHPLSWYP